MPPNVEAVGFGKSAAPNVPLEMFEALVVSVVADGASPVTSAAGIGGSLAGPSVPELIFDALVASIVAEGARPVISSAGILPKVVAHPTVVKGPVSDGN